MVNTRTLNSCACVLLAAISAATSDLSHAQRPTTGAGPSGGIWKAAVPPKPMKGEFESLDPLGVAAGARIKADCSLNCGEPHDGTLYCCASGTSLEFFLEQPQAHLERARAGWRKMSAHRD